MCIGDEKGDVKIMKRKISFIALSLLLGAELCGCQNVSEPVVQTESRSTVGMPEPEIQEGSEPGNAQADSMPEIQEGFSGDVASVDAVQGGPYGKISLSIPAGWDFEACPVDSGRLLYGMYGIRFFPENVEEGCLEIAYVDSFGVCGTGLETAEADIAGNPVSIGTYDGHEYWDFICFQGDCEGIVAFTYSVDGWWEEYRGQIMDILDTLSFHSLEREGGAYVYHEESEDDLIGLSFSLKNISPTGATLIFNQYDPDAPTGELDFGEDFVIEAFNNGKWEEVPVAVEGNYAFQAVAYMIAKGESTETGLDWKWLYGELPAGEYRIKKEIHDFRGTGDFDKHTVYARFVLN